jgi:protein-S-isoprenylcysteine O-methyltransferase Ste14
LLSSSPNRAVTELRVEPTRNLDHAGPVWLDRLAAPKLRHLGSSLVGASFWLLFAYANIRGSLESHRVLGAGVAILGLWAAVLFLVRRQPERVSRSLPVWVVAYVGTFGASLLRPGGSNEGWSDTLGLVVQGLGVCLGAVGYLALGRSFGLVPAHRGLVTSGIYRVVRHPLYASYIVVELGYLIQSPRLWNAGVLVIAWTCQGLRLLSEERLLSGDPAYRSYRERTRWRVIPGLW